MKGKKTKEVKKSEKVFVKHPDGTVEEVDRTDLKGLQLKGSREI